MKTGTRIVFFVLLLSVIFALAAFERMQQADRFMLPTGYCQACLERMISA